MCMAPPTKKHVRNIFVCCSKYKKNNGDLIIFTSNYYLDLEGYSFRGY